MPAEIRFSVTEQGVLFRMTEAGGVFSAAPFAAGLVEEVVVYVGPMLCGGPVRALAGAGLPESLRLSETSCLQFGNDVRIRSVVSRGNHVASR